MNGFAPEDIELARSMGLDPYVVDPRLLMVAADATDQAQEQRTTRRQFRDPEEWAKHYGIKLWDRCECKLCNGWQPPGDLPGIDTAAEKATVLPPGTQADILRSVRDNRETYVHAGHAVGKTFTGGALVNWWLEAFEDGRVLTTASSWEQVKNQLWAEVRTTYNAIKPAVVEGPHLTHWYPDRQAEPKHMAQGLSTREPDRFQGVHGARTLVIIDEGSGVAEIIYDAADRCLTGQDDRLVVMTNPLRLASMTNARLIEGRGNHIRLSVHDCLSWQRAHPGHGMPGLVSQTWVDETAARWVWGGAKHRIHLLGIYPESDSNYLFPPDLIAAACKRYRDLMKEGKLARMIRGRVVPAVPVDQIGVDVAGTGKDRTVWAGRWSSELMALLKQEDTTDHAIHRKEVQAYHRRHHVRQWAVDAGGEGSGTERELAHKKLPVDRYVGASAPADPERYANRRTESYYAFRDWLVAGGALPDNPELRRQLSMIEAKLVEKTIDDPDIKNGRKRVTVRQLLPKEQLKKALGGSPGEADACALACVPPLPTTEYYGFKNVASA